MLSSVQSSPLPTTAFAGPTTGAGATAGLDAVGSARLPVVPSGIQTAATVEANLGSTPVTQRAMAAMDFGEKSANAVSRLADFLDVNIGSALNFAHADVRRLSHDLTHNAPDTRTGQDTQRLLGDWATKGGQAFQAIRHGLFRNAEQDIGQAAHALSSAGVTNPEIQSSMREVASVLRMVDAFMAHPGMPGPIGGIGGGIGRPGGPVLDGPNLGGGIGGGAIGGGGIGGGPIGGGPLGPFDALFNRAMAKLNQAFGNEVQAHPEHLQAIRDASASVGNAVRQLNQGMTAVYVTQAGVMRDLQQLGWTPSPQPRPTPLPLPGPQPTSQAQPPAEPQAQAA
ncbi:MAG TPA: hypothetical protein VFA20_00480 [Myxococcaceae bacterium]|nr:hypothetical protein [Myxococcaceae bacterium]